MPFRTNECFAPLLGDQAIRSLFSTEATLSGMLLFEQALTRALGKTGAVDDQVARLALESMQGFEPDLDAISTAVGRDGLPVPEWARQLKAHVGTDLATAIHIGATSQDLLDTCQSLALKQANAVLDERLAVLIDALANLSSRFGRNPLMGRTRMQAALPIAVADRIALWMRPLLAHQDELVRLKSSIELIQYAGPVGLRDVPEGRANELAEMMATDLGLENSEQSWHANRENLVAYGQYLARLTGSLGKMGQDIALMAQQGLDEVRLAGAGISSAMPHKQNPVLAETLVALARYNAIQSGGLAQVLVHEQERSGAAWTLEWLLLPPMVETTARALGNGSELVQQIEFLGDAI
jgi:3-carboxy-cis,cis-muconate cycloisomerase